MSFRTIAVAALALISGASMAIGVMRTSMRSPAAASADVAMTTVVVAATDIPRGRKLVETDVQTQEWSTATVPAGSLATVEEAVERVPLGPIFAGELILDAKLSGKGARQGLAWDIPAGMRAYAIQSNRIASNVAGFILPGDKVDVLVNMKADRRSGMGTGAGSSSKTLVQNVEVLAVDQQREAPEENMVDPDKLSTVTLLVTPEQVERLDSGQNAGVLTLSLRNPDDDDEVDESIDELVVGGPDMDGDQPRPDEFREVTKPAVYAIVTLRGNHRGQIWLTAPTQP